MSGVRRNVIEFGILGPLEARTDGRQFALGGRRQRTVLARLLVDAGRVVTTDRLIDDVWDGDPPATAQKTLQKYVSELRKTLVRSVLRTTAGGYLLDIDDGAIDAARFESLLDSGDYSEALALWRGEVLADLPGAGFAAPERARLDELRLLALESRAEVQLDQGRHAEAVGGLAELVDSHPLRERLVALHMLALYRAGRHVEALRAFETHRRRLADDIGVEPAADVRELERAILRHDPLLLDRGSSRWNGHHESVSSSAPAPVSPAHRSSIGVLPFVDLSPREDNCYFCDGVAEELISALSAVKGLRVAARSSSFRYRSADVHVSAVGAELGVTAVLEGSVRRDGDQLRVTVRLTGTSDGFVLWSGTFDRQVGDVFHIQQEIAAKVVAALALDVGEAEAAKHQLQSVSTTNVAAYDVYVQGRTHFYRGGRRATVKACELFRSALVIAPEYAVPHAGLADASSFLLLYYDPAADHAATADEHSRLAVELDPRLPQAHSSRGFALAAVGAYGDAAREFDAALELHPEEFDALYLYGRTTLAHGEYEKAASLFARASQCRPDDFQVLTLLGKALRGSGRSGRAVEAHRRALRLVDHHLRIAPEDARVLCVGACALAELEQPDEAMRWAERAAGAHVDEPLMYYVACAYARLGHGDRALDALADTVAAGWSHDDWLRHDPDWADLRGDPQFTELLDRIVRRRPLGSSVRPP